MKRHNWIQRLLKQTLSASPRPEVQPMRPAMATKMLQAAAHTQDVELSCDDVLKLLDEFAEMVQRGEDATRAMPMLQQHLDMCPDCREEYEALMRILKANS